MSGQALISSIFASHRTQLAILLFWAAPHLFQSFVQAAGSGLRPSALSVHAIRDLHFGASAALSNASSLSAVSISGLYQRYFVVGMTSESQLLHAASFLCAIGAALLVVAFFHSRSVFSGSLAASAWQALVNHHLGAMLGTASLVWAGDLVHVALPMSGAQVDGFASFTQLVHPLGFNWGAYAAQPNGIEYMFSSVDAARGTAILTFLGGLIPASNSLYITDIAHHHLAVGIVVVFGFAKLVLQHRAFIISHPMSYVSLFLGFHTLGLYVMQACASRRR